MIEFITLSKDSPYTYFKEQYDAALNAGQSNIEAISISSYDKKKNLVDSRYVNLKFVIEDSFIFFSNYNSPKALAFNSHNQISALFYWTSINIQIRMKAYINKTSVDFNKNYFQQRSQIKNALAISSNQSKVISSYDEVIKKFKKTKTEENLLLCPSHWGGFEFKPFYFEFWKGDEYRLNKREVYEICDQNWKFYYLEP